jgi:Na+-driven multidrug efflux pump
MAKKILAYNLLVSACIYAVVYLFKSFIIWDFTNPIQWVIDIPSYRESVRLLILMCYVLYQFILTLATIQFLTEKANKKN